MTRARYALEIGATVGMIGVAFAILYTLLKLVLRVFP